jgi:hypothetical protein
LNDHAEIGLTPLSALPKIAAISAVLHIAAYFPSRCFAERGQNGPPAGNEGDPFPVATSGCDILSILSVMAQRLQFS